MIDPRLLREDPERIRAMFKARKAVVDFDSLARADADRRALQVQIDELRAGKNASAEIFGRLKKAGGADSPDGKSLLDEMRETDARLKAFEDRRPAVEEAWMQLILRVPNVPHPDVPTGSSETDNLELRRWGTPRAFSFEPKNHWEIGEALGLLDFGRAAKMSGARFSMFVGTGARLERALIQFMLDLHVKKHGYVEMSTPLMITPEAMQGTGQHPLYADDMYLTTPPDQMYLIPTAEVTLVNVHRDEILDGRRLPIRYVAYTPCFRREAGSYGKDIRGLIRVHQFDKVEMVQFVAPEDGDRAHGELTGHAEDVLQALELPYKVMLLSTAEMSLASHKSHDLECWFPAQKLYREISSCSTCGDFQARRAQIRFRREPKAKAELVHTLNGSGIAVGRTFAAIIENFQNADGSVTVPAALRPYLDGMETITGR